MTEHHHIASEDNEKKILITIILTVITMIAEIAYGYFTNSMALLADGYHMGTHALALGLTFVSYVLVRKFAHSELFPNGTGKINDLTAYTSSLFLGLTGVWIIIEAFSRFLNPLTIKFDDAIIVAVIGMIVNAACILIMEGKSTHEHSHEHEDDNNFKAAYYHILADLLTSILAICALLTGKFFNILCLDSIVGILGGILILKWAAGLLKNTVKVLVDMKS